MKKIKITIAQLKYEIGAINENCNKIIKSYREAVKNKSNLIIFSDLATTGYPPSEILMHPDFQKDYIKIIEKIKLETKNHSTFIIVGGILVQNECIHNAMFLIGRGQIFSTILKHTVECSNIYNESKIFTPTLFPKTVIIDNVKINIIIGSDSALYQLAGIIAKTGVDIIISVDTTIYTKQSNIILSEKLSKLSKETSLPIIYVNQVGSNENNTIKGGSFIMSSNGTVTHRMPEWKECVTHTEWEKFSSFWECTSEPIGLQQYNEIENCYRAMLCSLKNIIQRKKFDGIIIPMNNTIGAELSTILALDASDSIVVQNIHFSKNNKSYLSDKLKIQNISITTENIASSVLSEINQYCENFKNKELLEAETMSALALNIAREKNMLLLSTADKTDIAMGNCIHENIFAQYSIIGDFFKSDLLKIIEWRNKNSLSDFNVSINNPIDQKILKHKTQSHSLKVNIEKIDRILKEIIENNLNYTDVIKLGYDPKIVKKINDILILSIKKPKLVTPMRISNAIINLEWPIPGIENYYKQKQNDKNDI